jgi:chromosome segregation ATPase
MTGKISTKVFILIIIICILSSILLGYALYQRNKELTALRESLEAQENRSALLQKKYAEQKAFAAVLQRSKLNLEGRVRRLGEEIDALNAEKEQLLKEKASGSKTSEALQDQINAQSKKIMSLEDRITDLTKKLNQAEQRIAKKDETIEKLIAEKEAVELKLSQTDFSLQRCEKNNRRLSEISVELVDKYENKGVGTSIIQNEPFTQIKKVEFEKLIQEYLDQIDKATIEQ